MCDGVALEVERVEKRYGDFVLRASLGVRSGEVVGVVGPNGSGKTTLLRCVLGLVRPDGGRIRCWGMDLEGHEVEIKRRMGFFLEEAPLFRQVRVRDVLRFCAAFYPRWDGRGAEALMRRFGLDERKKVGELSKGMRAQLGLTVAFSSRGDLLLLDEPTAALDPGMRRECVELVRMAVREWGAGVLVTSHILADVEGVADRVVFLRRGEVVRIESRERLRRNWRRIRGRYVGQPRLDFREWVAVEEEGRGWVQVVTDQWEEGMEDRVREAGLVEIEVEALSLEEIYGYVLRETDQER